MEFTNLYDIQEASAYILNSWTLGLREAQLHGRNSYFELFRDAYRVHYLYGRIKASYILNDKIYIGNEETTLAAIADTYFTLWHYRGTFIENGLYGGATDTEIIGGEKDTVNIGIITKPPVDEVDDGGQGGDVETELPPIVPDDGTGNSDTGVGGDSGGTIVYESTINLRAGSQGVTVGTNVVTFFLNGVATPLEDNDYILDAYVVTVSGRQQRNLVVSQQLAGGFVVTDILEAGTIWYQAIPRT